MPDHDDDLPDVPTEDDADDYAEHDSDDPYTDDAFDGLQDREVEGS